MKTAVHIELDLDGDRRDAAARIDALLAAMAKAAPTVGARIESTHVDRLRPAGIGSGR